MNDANALRLINEAVAIEANAAKEAGALGFVTRALVQATMPHKDPGKLTVFERKNGAITLTMMSPPAIGLPFGSVPRLLVCYLATEAVRTHQRLVSLGKSLSGFMHTLGMEPTGGATGSITRLKKQMEKLFSCAITYRYSNEELAAFRNVAIADEAALWWEPKNPDQAALWNSTVTLSERFFRETVDSPVPIDVRALRALKKSPLAIDAYCWLSYRLFYVKRRTAIPWGAVQAQFGADYPRDDQGQRNFRRAFGEALKKVQIVYPEASVNETKESLILHPSRSHVLTGRG